MSFFNKKSDNAKRIRAIEDKAKKEGIKIGLGEAIEVLKKQGISVSEVISPENFTDSWVNETLKERSSWFKAVWEDIIDYSTSIRDHVSFDQTRLNRIQKRVAEMYREDVLIRAVGNLMQRSVVGAGIHFTTGNRDIDTFLHDLWGKSSTDMESRQKEITLHRYLMGEYFLVYFIDLKNKLLEIRKFYPWEIQEVMVDSDDDEKVVGVVRKMPNGTDYQKFEMIDSFIKNRSAGSFVQYIKLSDGFDTRGYPQVFVLLRWAAVVREMVYDVAAKFHEWAKVLYVLTIEDKGKDWTSDTGRRAPKGGTVIVNSNQAKWDVFESRMDADGIGAVWSMMMYYFSAGANFPYQYIVHDYSNNNYASGKEARVPFTQLINDQQDSLSSELDTVLRVFLAYGIACGDIPENTVIPAIEVGKAEQLAVDILHIVTTEADSVVKVDKIASKLKGASVEKSVPTDKIPITITFPKIPPISEKEQADILKIYKEIGIDTQTIAEEAGYDWAKVRARQIAAVDFDAEIANKRADLMPKEVVEPTTKDKTPKDQTVKDK